MARKAKPHKPLNIRLSDLVSSKLAILAEVNGTTKTQIVEEAISLVYDETFVLVQEHIQREAPDRAYPPHSRFGYEGPVQERARKAEGHRQTEEPKEFEATMAQMIQEFEVVATEKMKEVIEKYKGQLEVEGSREIETKGEPIGQGPEKKPPKKTFLEEIAGNAPWRISAKEDKDKNE
ncbi:hypothetical protein SBDP1_340005 [Syntrophobacter sp. SbD1]|nr:hypothetical protein SBDP1_340005 [Syntrophobacter sp. SbD1]